MHKFWSFFFFFIIHRQKNRQAKVPMPILPYPQYLFRWRLNPGLHFYRAIDGDMQVVRCNCWRANQKWGVILYAGNWLNLRNEDLTWYLYLWDVKMEHEILRDNTILRCILQNDGPVSKFRRKRCINSFLHKTSMVFCWSLMKSWVVLAVPANGLVSSITTLFPTW